MSTSDLNIARDLAVFLKDYGIYAFASLLLFAVLYLYRAKERADREKFEVAIQVVPLVDRITRMLERAATAKARRGNESQPPVSREGVP